MTRALVQAVLFAAVATGAAGSASAAISGRVVTPEGKPVAGAAVTAYALETGSARGERIAAGGERTPLGATRAGADGSFRLEVADAAVGIGVRADGYAPAGETALQGEPVVITAFPARMRRGKITVAGKPAAVAMTWMNDLDDPQSAELVVRSGPDGVFEVPDPDEWATSVAAFPAGGLPFYAVPSPRWPPSLAFEVKAGKPLRGRVVDAATGAGVAGAKLWLDGWLRTASGADGTFVIPHSDPHWGQIVGRTAALAGIARQGSGPAVVTMHPARTVAGNVRDSATGQPIAGVAVSVWDERRAAYSDAITDARGRYSAGGLPPGRYHPYAVREGYETSSPEMTEPLDLRKSTAASHDIALDALRRLSGRVQDGTGQPVEGALLLIFIEGLGTYYGDVSEIFGGAPERKQLTGADGRFSFPLSAQVAGLAKSANMPAAILALKPGFAVGRTRIPPPGADRPIVIPLPKGVPLRGKVIGPDGKPIPDVAVGVLEPGAMLSVQTLRGAELAPWTRTDAGGSFSVQVHPVRHQLIFRKEGFAPKGVDVADPSSGAEVAVTLEPGAAVRGRVVRSDGRGLAEASLSLADHSIPPAGVGAAVSEADGSFAFEDLVPGSYDLRIEHAATGLAATRPVQAPVAGMRVEIAPTATVRGRVVDSATRAPLTRFYVSFARDPRLAQGSDHPGERGEWIDAADGVFAVDDVPAGESVLSVHAEGYRPKRIEGVAVSTEPGAPEIEIALDAGVTLRGRVTDPEGEPVAEARVAASGAANNASATTDASGEYEIKGLAAGEATILVAAARYRSVRRTVDPQQTPRLDVTLTRGIVVSGVVVSNDAGVPKARVMASSGTLDADSQNAVTDAAGRFTLQGLAPGRYDITAWTEDAGKAELKDVDVATAGSLRLSIDRSAKAVVAGTVTGLAESADGRPSIVAVRVVGAEGGGAMALVDPGGAFRVEDAPAGRVTVVAAAMSGGATRMSRSNELELQPGTETMTVLEFKDDFVVSGRVVRAGAPVPNASVTFQAGQRGAAASTDRDGRYEMSVAAGEYSVAVSAQNLHFTTEHVVTASGTFDIDVTGGGLRGRVVAAGTGAPVAGAAVSLWLSGAGENSPASTLTTTDAGSFEAASLRDGRYRVVASRKGFGQETKEVDIARGATADVVLELQPAEGVTVTVTDARDGRPLEAIVVVRDSERRIIANRHAGADAEGAVTIPLADGAYVLSTSATGYGTATLPIRSPARGLRVALTPGGTLVIESSRPVSGKIRLVQPDGEEYVRCWCDGIAEIKMEGRRTTVEHVATGSYTMELVGADPAFSRPIVIQEGMTTTVTID